MITIPRLALKQNYRLFLLGRPAMMALAIGGSFAPANAQIMQQEGPDIDELDEMVQGQGQAQVPVTGPQDDPENVIIVTADRIRGSVVSDVPPLEVLNAQDLQSYGAGSLEDLLEALGPQANSSRGRGSGRPEILVNGRRVSGFRAIRDLPPEAIERVEIFPEELAQEYGFAPDQRVINFILKSGFSSIAAEIEHGMATQGGYGVTEVESTYTRLGDGSRLVIDLEYEHNTKLFESERDIIQSDDAPFALGGNVVSAPFVSGNEIDPALSALAGQLVTVAGVPVVSAGATPLLADFLGAPNATDIGQFRTLVPGGDKFEANVTYGFNLTKGVFLQLNGTYERDERTSLFGLNEAALNVPDSNPFSPFSGPVSVLRYFDDPRALTRDTTTDNYQLGLSADGRLSGWRWALTGNFARVDTQTLTDQRTDFTALQDAVNLSDPQLAANPFAAELSPFLIPAERAEAQSTSETISAGVTTSGSLLDLPAGSVQLTLNTGYNRRTIDSSNSLLGAAGDRSLARSDWSVSGNVNIPLLEEGDFLNIGDLSVNGNLGYDEISDFGGLVAFGGGIRWSPISPVSFAISYRGSEAAPSVQQLGDPVIVTPNVTIFDQSRNESVLIDVITGGNPALPASKRRDFTASFNISPEFLDGLRFTGEYIRNRSFDDTAGFPALTPEIEAAFPDRIFRDSDGMLTAIDQRAVTYAEVASDRIRYGVTFSKRIGGSEERRGGGGRADRRAGADGSSARRNPEGGRAPPPSDGQEAPAEQSSQSPSPDAPNGSAPATTADAPPAQARGDRAARGGGRGGFGRGRGGGRWNVSLFHTVRLTETILIAPGVPELDLLNGSAIGNNGGVARHSVELEGGWFNKGIGMRLSGNYGSATRVDGGLATGATGLNFGALATLNARLFIDLDQQESIVKAVPLLKGSRLSFRVDNVFDAQRRVTNDLGEVPLGFQAARLDPIGRIVEVSLRKRF
jgi:iron complex outermembrane receptor protein